MKRVLTIGRDYSSDIHINDHTDIVSRNHAVIEVGLFGKYYIIDQSRNGTYVNGMRIPSQQKYEVRRGDEVSLAHTAQLDWSQVPKDNTLLLIIIGVVSILLAVTVVFAVWHYSDKSSSAADVEWVSGGNSSSNSDVDTPVDSEKVVVTPSNDKNEKAKNGQKKDGSKTSTPKNTNKAKTEKSTSVDKPVDAIY